MFTRKPHLQLEIFAMNGAKRLLQHNRPEGDIQAPFASTPNRDRLQAGAAPARRAEVLLDFKRRRGCLRRASIQSKFEF